MISCRPTGQNWKSRIKSPYLWSIESWQMFQDYPTWKVKIFTTEAIANPHAEKLIYSHILHYIWKLTQIWLSMTGSYTWGKTQLTPYPKKFDSFQGRWTQSWCTWFQTKGKVITNSLSVSWDMTISRARAKGCLSWITLQGALFLCFCFIFNHSWQGLVSVTSMLTSC